LAFPPETEEQVVATDIREVHITNGRIWTSNLAWRRLPNLHKLQVVEPTNPWETATRDEFKDMVNLELLDLSGNSTIQVLPSLSGATSLKTLILDGCNGLEHVGPQGLPPSLESFSLNTAGAGNKDHKKNAKISYISFG
jgi:Leucine-rich repeat (LRR) protein